MKPERIQFAALLRALLWGIFQTLRFETPVKAKNFENFLLDMGDNYGRDVACKFDETKTEVTLLVAAISEDDLPVAKIFIDKVLHIYALWSDPAVELNSVGEITPDHKPPKALYD